ncbi:DUF4249 domain-containing protein [Tenacibaculum sp. 190524A05c]|uniref:DUF4249 domain-containing protein n=1 Tax=Tenacibaculum platacis TaxID=3137852 RepID=UPI0032B28C51
MNKLIIRNEFKVKPFKLTVYISFFIMLFGCIEQVEFAPIATTSNLVVRARITNEVKTHTIELSRTIPINSSLIDYEKNATVFLTDDTGNIYNFQEVSDGIYNSVNPFAAEENKKYELHIETSNGLKYISTQESLPGLSTIGDVNLSVEPNQFDPIDELVIKVNSNVTTDNGKYYRYEYDETFEIKTPLWSSKKLLIISDSTPYEFELVDKTEEEDGIGLCYPNNQSNSLMLTETVSLAQDQVIGFPVRKIPIRSYFIGRRYSILIKQYVINQNTFDFYTLLNKFSSPDDIFSQTQVGNIPSNISAEINPTEDKVVGFFEVSSVSTKRIFINRNEFTSEPFMNYRALVFCDEFVKPEIVDASGLSPLLTRLNTGWIYQSLSEGPSDVPGGPYRLIRKPCGDCSHLGPVNPPDFWIE